MTRIRTLFQFIMALALLIFLGWVAYELLAWVVRAIIGLQSDLATAIIAAAATIIVSVLSLVISKNLDRQATITQELREKKIPIYEELISTLFKVQFSDKLVKKPMSQEEIVQTFAGLTERLIVWGSDEVVDAFRALRSASTSSTTKESTQTPNTNFVGSLFLYENMLLAIRKDLGHKNRNFKKGSLLALYINDIDKYL